MDRFVQSKDKKIPQELGPLLWEDGETCGVQVGTGIFLVPCYISACQNRKYIPCSEGKKDILGNNSVQEPGRATALCHLTGSAVLCKAKP